MKERPKNPEKYACICYQEFDRKLVRHLVAHRNTHNYPRVTKQTCQQRWLAGLIGGKPRMPISERDLDVCLMKETERTVQKYGCIEFECLIYSAGWHKDSEGLWRYDKDADFLRDYKGKVSLRYNPSNIIHILVYTQEKNGQPAQYLGTLRAKHAQERDLYRDEERLSLQEWQERKNKRREEGKLVEYVSILAEQRDLTVFSNEMVKAHRQRKRITKQIKSDEQATITRQSITTKVVEFPAQKSIQTVKNQSQTLTTTDSRPTSESEIQVKPAFYVVADWHEFVENYW